MSKLDRTLISRGSALIRYRGHDFLSEGDITLDFNQTFGDIQSSAFGVVDKFRTGVTPKISFKLLGAFAALGVLWPHAATSIGASIVGPTDNELIIMPLDSTQPQWRFRSGVVSKMPSLKLTSQGTMLEDVEFTCLPKNNYPIAATDRYFIVETNTISSIGYDPAEVLVQPWTGTWISRGQFTLTYGANTTPAIAAGATAAAVATALNNLASITTAGGVTVTGSFADGYTVTFTATGTRTALSGAIAADGTGGTMPTGTTVKQEILTAGATGVANVALITLSPWAGFTTLDGFSVAFDMSTTEVKNDAAGVVDLLLSDLKVTCTATPQGITEVLAAQAAVLQGPSAQLGKKVSTGANDLQLVSAGGDAYVWIYAANLTKDPFAFSREKDRLGTMEWSASRSVAAGGTVNPLFYIGTSAPA